MNRFVLATGAAFVYGGTAAAAYFYARSHVVLPTNATSGEGKDGAASAPGHCAFDALAKHYDSAIGQEEVRASPCPTGSA